MPEGDTVAGHARRLRPVLVGRRIVSVGGTSSAVRRRAPDILDATVDSIRSVGKHLVIDLDSGYGIRVHLGMSGSWRVSAAAMTPPGSARLVLSTQTHHVACLAAPTVHVERVGATERVLARLGPDLLGDFDESEYLRRARLYPETPIHELLLDQRVLTGVGNVYKSELLFLEQIHPDARVSSLSDEQLFDLAGRAQRLLAANVGRRRSTTGSRARDRQTWVYGRHNEPCRRCGTPIVEQLRRDRITYWCPTCQGPGEQMNGSPSPAAGDQL